MARNLLFSPGKVNTPDVADMTAGIQDLFPLLLKSGAHAGDFPAQPRPGKFTPPNHFWFEGVNRRVSPF